MKRNLSSQIINMPPKQSNGITKKGNIYINKTNRIIALTEHNGVGVAIYIEPGEKIEVNKSYNGFWRYKTINEVSI